MSQEDHVMLNGLTTQGALRRASDREHPLKHLGQPRDSSLVLIRHRR